MADWATVSSLATAGGTLVLAVATFVSGWTCVVSRVWNLDRPDPR